MVTKDVASRTLGMFVCRNCVGWVAILVFQCLFGRKKCEKIKIKYKKWVNVLTEALRGIYKYKYTRLAAGGRA